MHVPEAIYDFRVFELRVIALYRSVHDLEVWPAWFPEGGIGFVLTLAEISSVLIVVIWPDEAESHRLKSPQKVDLGVGRFEELVCEQLVEEPLGVLVVAGDFATIDLSGLKPLVEECLIVDVLLEPNGALEAVFFEVLFCGPLRDYIHTHTPGVLRIIPVLRLVAGDVEEPVALFRLALDTGFLVCVILVDRFRVLNEREAAELEALGEVLVVLDKLGANGGDNDGDLGSEGNVADDVVLLTLDHVTGPAAFTVATVGV